MRAPRVSRRSVLRRVGAVAGAGILAGCSGNDGSGADGSTPQFRDEFGDAAAGRSGDGDDPGTVPGGYDWRSRWRAYVVEGDGVAWVRPRESPDGGNRAMAIRETTGGGTAFAVGTRRRFRWDGPWTLVGAYYTAFLDPTSPYLGHRLAPYYDPEAGHDFNDGSGLSIEVGVTDGNGDPTPVEFEETPLVESRQRKRVVDWEGGRWYAWEFHHDGEGTYFGWFWSLPSPEGVWRPPTADRAVPTGRPHVLARGRPPDPDPRPFAMQVNGARDRGMVYDYAFVGYHRGSVRPGLVWRTVDPEATTSGSDPPTTSPSGGPAPSG